MLAQGHLLRLGSTISVVAALCCAVTSSAGARSDLKHTVKSGQSLIQIAKLYRVGADALAAANGMTRTDPLRGGQVLTVPPEGVVFVGKGQTLGTIARTHGVSIAALAKANKLEPEASLQIGQRLLLPGAKPSPAPVDARADKPMSRAGTPKRPGAVTFYRIWSQETIKLRLLDDKGAVRMGALRQMREFMRPRESRKRKLPHERLMRLLADVSNHFGNRPLHVVSGYRLPGGLTRDTSRHVAGEAMDFRVPGVPLEELRDYCQRFKDVGVGFYPRTQFVHLDVRKQNARWTDWSLPGQAPVLQKPDDLDERGRPIEAEPILPASDADLQDAPDDGEPPTDAAPLHFARPIANELGNHEPK
ncbi:MAG TPA: LysM peptidoglycan-binding domain-containing protein [Polyangiales bacterium]|nr:LysM peptidoglycan-binding domain-containing protein [Polyangiales bacterium]